MKLTRRRFVQWTTLAAASSCFPSGVFSQATAPSPRIRWGIIGAGHRGSIHLNTIKSFTDDFQLIAVCDVRKKQLDNAARRAGGVVKTFGDYHQLLANPDIDAVLIATPNLVHKEAVLAALHANKHLMCEKPMAVTHDECKAMKLAAEQRPDRVVLYTMQLRYSPRFAAMRKAIEDGKIGRPRYQLFVESRGDWNPRDVWQYADPALGGKPLNWRFSHAATGGTLSEKSCHFLDLMNWMAGEVPSRVTCTGGISVYKDGRNTWDNAQFTCEYPAGSRATHTLCMFGPKRMDYQIIGDEGSLFVQDAGPEGGPVVLQSRGKSENLPVADEILHGRKGQETAVTLMYQDFLACLRQNKKPWMDADKAMAACKCAWLGELSSDQKREVKWDEIA